MGKNYNIIEYISFLSPDGLNKSLDVLLLTFLEMKSLRGSEETLNLQRNTEPNNYDRVNKQGEKRGIVMVQDEGQASG